MICFRFRADVLWFILGAIGTESGYQSNICNEDVVEERNVKERTGKSLNYLYIQHHAHRTIHSWHTSVLSEMFSLNQTPLGSSSSTIPSKTVPIYTSLWNSYPV